MTGPTFPDWYERETYSLKFHGMDGTVVCDTCNEPITVLPNGSVANLSCGCPSSDDFLAHGAQYGYWHGSDGDWIDDETVSELRTYHGDNELMRCGHCGCDVHVISGGCREQTSSWIRYGPFFLCGECVAAAFDLPELPSGLDGPWWENVDAIKTGESEP